MVYGKDYIVAVFLSCRVAKWQSYKAQIILIQKENMPANAGIHFFAMCNKQGKALICFYMSYMVDFNYTLLIVNCTLKLIPLQLK